ncbi:MAG: nitrous oxide reductase family maturation protein NosD [Gemmatimonadetes bacterium]|nr:nitrous oxide reductase family maturation protein NosD [Gemmatimonadota bacterium]
MISGSIGFSVLLSLSSSLGSLAGADTIHVGPDGHFLTVSEALAAAAPGDRIEVHAGLYREPTLVVDQPVELVGVGWPTLDGEQEREILRIEADDVTVRGFEFQDVGVSYVEDRAAIRVEEAGGCRIIDNRINNAFFGIYLAQTHSCLIRGNRILGAAEKETSSGNGIHLWYSRDITIEDNQISNHRDGIYLEFVEDSRIRGNLSTENLRYGLHFMFSDGCVYEGNEFLSNSSGVAVMYTKRVTMLNNLFQDNWGSAAFGLLLKDITDSEIRGNRFIRNTVAIYAEGSNRLTVEENELRENGWAVKIMANSQDCRFSRNDFYGNTFDVATNSRRAYSTFVGNYWDNYRGYDLDRNGIGDVPFHPVRLFSLIAEQDEPSLILLRSFFVDLLDLAERILPVLTPKALQDEEPLMAPWRASAVAVTRGRPG